MRPPDGQLPASPHKVWELQVLRVTPARDAGGGREDVGTDYLAAAWGASGQGADGGLKGVCRQPRKCFRKTTLP